MSDKDKKLTTETTKTLGNKGLKQMDSKTASDVLRKTGLAEQFNNQKTDNFTTETTQTFGSTGARQMDPKVAADILRDKLQTKKYETALEQEDVLANDMSLIDTYKSQVDEHENLVEYETVIYDQCKVNCNIELQEIRGLDIESRPNEHAQATVLAVISPDQESIVVNKLSEQPIRISVKNNLEWETFFYGVIVEAEIKYEADYILLRIQAYSLSWFLDLEQKRRSFQRHNQTHTELYESVLREQNASAVYHIEDRPIAKPYIQYDETDWIFIRRLASCLNTVVVPAIHMESTALYIGFPQLKKRQQIDNPVYRIGVDERYAKNRKWSKRQFTYYDVEDTVPRQIGDQVIMQEEELVVSAVKAQLLLGIMCFTYRLTRPEYNEILPMYNPALQGRSITGTVLERKAELLRLHLEIDEEQDIEDAYFYTWLPETGNILYSMPQLGTRVSLYMQTVNEHSAICVGCVRENGAVCPQTQDTDHRYLITEHEKSFSIKPETMELTTLTTGSSILLDDNFGELLNSRNEVLIQAEGNLTIRSANVTLKAPQEVTAVRRRLGEPSVINLCHNVDSTGDFGKFKATGIYTKPLSGKRGRLTAYEDNLGEPGSAMETEKRKKLQFELAELKKRDEEIPRYDLSDIYRNVLAAIPEDIGNDRASRFVAGSRVLFSKLGEE